MAQVRDIIKIDVSPEIAWEILVRSVVTESCGDCEVNDRRALEARPRADAEIGYELSPLGLLSYPEAEPQPWGEIILPILVDDAMVKRAWATFFVESHDQGTVVRLSIDYKLVVPALEVVGWRRHFTLSPGLLGKLVLYPRVGRLLLKSIRYNLLDFKQYMEAGEYLTGEIPASLDQAA